ncbi:MAG: hypothetical protein AAGE86_08110 [Pseudomonadota bacterium]
MRSPGLICTAIVLAACQAEQAEPTALTVDPERTEATSSPDAAQADAESGAGTDTITAVADVAKRSAVCSAKEEPLFSCTATNGKQISVCASAEGKAEYRYGKDEAELVLSDPVWASVAYSGGGEAQIAFDNGDTRYIVFSRVVRTNFTAGEPNNPAISDGVIVQRGDTVLNVQACGGEGELKPIDYFATERLVPQRRNELFTFETSRADPF